MIEFSISGDASQIKMSIGMDACVSVFGFQKCEPNPPFDLLSGAFDFSNICLQRPTYGRKQFSKLHRHGDVTVPVPVKPEAQALPVA